MLEGIINKLKTSKFQPLVATLLIYDFPLIGLLIPNNTFKYIIVLIIQLIMSYACMRVFNDADEPSRSKNLHIQFFVACIGLVVSYLYGKSVGITVTNELIAIMTSLLISLPVISGILCALLYSLINMIMCGSGVVLGVLIELLKDNDYL